MYIHRNTLFKKKGKNTSHHRTLTHNNVSSQQSLTSFKTVINKKSLFLKYIARDTIENMATQSKFKAKYLRHRLRKIAK